MKATCGTKSALILNYGDAAKVYAELVSHLHDQAVEVQGEEYRKLYAVAEHWRVRTEKEREALEHHVEQHGC